MVFLPDGRWYWNSRQLHGGALEFAIQYEQRSLPEAVLILLGEMPAKQEESAQATQSATFLLPPIAEDVTPLTSYLIRRGIDGDITLELIRQHRLYLTFHRDGTVRRPNAVFVGFDGKGAARSAILRGIGYGSTYKSKVCGSDPLYPFVLPGARNAGTLAVFESPIDALSHATLHRKERQATHRAAFGGAPANGALSRLLERCPKIGRVLLCFDNDDAGRAMAERAIAELRNADVRIETILPPMGKDWNDYLLQNKS